MLWPVNSDLQIGVRGRLRVRVNRTEYALQACRAKIFEVRVLRTLNSYSQSSSYSNLKVANDCRKTNSKVITSSNQNTGGKQRDERPEVLAITCNLLQALEKSSFHAATAFGSHWLKNWLDIVKPIKAQQTQSHSCWGSCQSLWCNARDTQEKRNVFGFLRASRALCHNSNDVGCTGYQIFFKISFSPAIL